MNITLMDNYITIKPLTGLANADVRLIHKDFLKEIGEEEFAKNFILEELKFVNGKIAKD